jgi:tight adherence protein B
MTFVVATFLIAMSVMFGTYWLLVMRPEAADRSTAVARLRDYKIQGHTQSLVMGEARLSSIPLLDRLLRHRQNVTGPVERLLVESGLKMTVGSFVLTVVVAAVAGSVAAWMLTGMFSAAAVMAVIGGLLPFIYVRRKRAVRLRVFEEQFPEAIDLISRALRAGHAFTTGLGMVAEEIPAPVGQEFRRLYDEQNFGMSLPDALRAMAYRVPVLDARFFVTAVLTQRESGGNLSEVLDNLASVILLSPDFMRILWEDPLGVRLVIIAVTLQIVGTFIISRMVRIEY